MENCLTIEATEFMGCTEEDPTIYCRCGREADGVYDGEFLCDACTLEAMWDEGRGR